MKKTISKSTNVTLGLTTAFILAVAFTTVFSSAKAGCLTGIVTDRSGAPVVGGDLDFDNALTGLRLLTPGDNTGVGGFYNVCLLAGIYHVSFAPPPNSHLVGLRLFDVSLLTSKELNVTLESGIVISGVVKDTLGFPIATVNLSVDSLGAGRTYTPGDKTDSSLGLLRGTYRIVVPPHDLYRLRFKPPPGMKLQVGQIDSIALASDTIINMTLFPGMALSGTVSKADGSPAHLARVNLKRASDGTKVPLANNTSDTLGNYETITPWGMFTLQFAPPLGEPLIGVEIDSVLLNLDTTINATLSPGKLISVTVVDEKGVPVPNADIDMIRESNRVRVYLPHDKTLKDGTTTVVAAADSYEIKVDPPLGAFLARKVTRNVSILTDTAFTVVLVTPTVRISGRFTDRQGVGIPGVSISAKSLSTRPTGKVKRPLSDSDGFFNTSVPQDSLDILISPPRGSRFVGMRLTDINLMLDSALGTIALDTGIVVTVHVVSPQGMPASNYDLSLLANGSELFTPHDSVSVFGEVVVTVPPGLYNMLLVPPQGVIGDSLTLSGVSLSSDTTFTLILGNDSPQKPTSFVLRQNFPNPFNGVTKIPYLLKAQSHVVMTIHNVLGQVVRTFDFGEQTPGYYTPVWDTENSNGRQVASGVYFYRLLTTDREESRKMLFIQ